MIEDFGQVAEGATLRADICIVGAGAVGIALALEFLNGPMEVLLIEGGGKQHEAECQALHLGEIAGLPHKNLNEGRARVLGGTTTRWAGQASPLEPIVFRERPWVPQAAWPISRDDLEPYFRRSERVLAVPNASYDELSWPRKDVRLPEIDRDKLRMTYAQFSPRPDFRRLHGESLRNAKNVGVLLHANVAAIVSNESATRVDHLKLATFGGKTGRVVADSYVLCCGAIETPRLLLSSNEVCPKGLGNEHDLVGRFFQEHIHAKTVVIRARDRQAMRRLFEPCRGPGGVKCVPKIAASEHLQQREKILGVAAELIHESDPDSPVEAAKLILRAPRRRDTWDRLPKAVLNIVRRPHELVEAGFHHCVLRRPLATKRGPVILGVQSESEPNPDSRVTLGNERDALGMRRSRLDWRLTELDRRTIQVFVKNVADEFSRLGLGELDLNGLDPSIACLPGNLGAKIVDANHQMGTTRMSDDPRKGVVDRDCRIHGVENLYVGGASVFPSGGFSNPTVNAIALVLRLADRLKDRTAVRRRRGDRRESRSPAVEIVEPACTGLGDNPTQSRQTLG